MRNDYRGAIRVAEIAVTILKLNCSLHEKELMDFWKLIGVIAAEQSEAPENIILWWKELGVDIGSCSHMHKNYSMLATTACATRYRVVFWECEECGYLEAEQPTKEDVGVE